MNGLVVASSWQVPSHVSKVNQLGLHLLTVVTMALETVKRRFIVSLTIDYYYTVVWHLF